MRYYFEKSEASVTHRAKLVKNRSRATRRRNKVSLALDLDAFLKVPLIRENLLKPAHGAER